MGVDFLAHVEAVIPGAQGRVLAVLARTEAELTIRSVAHLAGVSVNRAAAVVRHLVSLGLVNRREAGSAALVRLARDNEAACAVIALANLRESVLVRLRDEARSIRPAPVSMVIFGSFATGTARADSDLDVLVVPGADTDPDDDAWIDAVGRWCDRAAAITGNAVNLMLAVPDEIPNLVRRRDSVWDEIARHGVVLFGTDLADLSRVQ